MNPSSSASNSVFCAIARSPSPLLKTPSTTRTNATTPRYWSYDESKTSARGGATASPAGAGIRSTTASSTSATPSPVLAEIRSTWSGVSPISAETACRRPLGVGLRQVDLVQDGDDLEVVLDRQVRVRDRLRLDPLRRVDDEHRALARLQRARHLVREVDVPGRVDQVQLVALPHDADGLRLDRDAALALEIHRVEQLLAHLPARDGVGHLEDAVGQRRLAVVDVRDDREVADLALIHVLNERSGDQGGEMSGQGFETTTIAALERPDGWSPIRRAARRAGLRRQRVDGARARRDDLIPAHDEKPSDHEELYVVVAGRATFTVDGEHIDAPTGTVVLVRDPAADRGAVAAEPGTTVLAVGGEPGKPYRPRAWETNADVFALLDAGKNEEAKEMLLGALDRYDDRGLILYNLACAEAQLGETDAALEHIASALAGAARLRRARARGRRPRADPRRPAVPRLGGPVEAHQPAGHAGLLDVAHVQEAGLLERAPRAAVRLLDRGDDRVDVRPREDDLARELRRARAAPARRRSARPRRSAGRRRRPRRRPGRPHPTPGSRRRGRSGSSRPARRRRRSGSGRSARAPRSLRGTRPPTRRCRHATTARHGHGEANPRPARDRLRRAGGTRSVAAGATPGRRPGRTVAGAAGLRPPSPGPSPVPGGSRRSSASRPPSPRRRTRRGRRASRTRSAR